MYQIIFRTRTTPDCHWHFWTIEKEIKTIEDAELRCKNLHKSYKEASFAILYKL